MSNRLAFDVLHASFQADAIRLIRQMTAAIARDPQSLTRMGDEE